MKTILHCDLNNFFASVECLLNPEIKDKPVAVCGSIEERRGIVLAKNEKAKSMGVTTAEPIWQAQKKCHNLVIVKPHMDMYEYYSKRVHEIYTNYTDMIEPFGIDECWLDVTGSLKLFDSGEKIAYMIKEEVKKKTGLTISVGVSFNKVFAKLGSDMKKPDAVTMISYDDFRQKVWCLPCNDMIGIGNSTWKKLKRYSINTLGELANTPDDFLKRLLGINGLVIKKSACGLDDSEVCHQNYHRKIKSIGNSITTREDMYTDNDVWEVMLFLSQSVSYRLRKENLSAGGVQISVKTSDLCMREFQCGFYSPVRTSLQLSEKAFELFRNNFKWEKNVRAIGIRAINLSEGHINRQLSILEDNNKIENLEKIEDTVDTLKKRYGNDVVIPLRLKNCTDLIHVLNYNR